VTELDALFATARSGDTMAFAAWAGRIERPVRSSLSRFARAVDLEVVVQETLLRMWLLATRSGRELTGEHASLRMALAVARNVAREELRRAKLGSLVPLEDCESEPELVVPPQAGPDPGLAHAIRDCIARIRGRPRAALELRIHEGHERPDRELAQQLGLKLNTFLQHIVRARRSLADCLRRKGVDLAGVSS
jgi:DNA-directed RNA polymerase specialized sigma24 family protein